MNWELFFDKTGILHKGRELFRVLHARIDEKNFIEAKQAYEESDEAFGAYLAALAPCENISIEELTLYFYIRFSEYTYEEYKKLGIDDEIFYATMSDLAVTSRQNVELGGTYGITQEPERPWIRLHLSCRLFRLGRLQFELMESEHDFELQGKKIKKGEPCLNVHIARYSPLTEEECEKSYAFARKFFYEHYGIKTCFFFCESWFLHPWLSEVLPESSQILRFSKKYTLLENMNNPDDPIYYIFLNKKENIDDYPENTSLQRHLKKRLKENLPVGDALGIRL